MKSVTEIKSLGDVRTGISAHARSAPRRKGSTYLEVYLLDKERQRLETELAVLARRQRRIEGRLGEIWEVMGRAAAKAREESAGSRPPASAAGEIRTAEPSRADASRWKTMTAEY